MEKIRVSICTCPNCYTAAATHFEQLNTILGAKMKTEIVLSGTVSPGLCAANDPVQTPVVTVGDQLIPGATPAT